MAGGRVVSAFVTLLPVADRNDGSLTSGPRAVPANWTQQNGVVVRLDVTTGVLATPFAGLAFPFSDPLMQIIFITEFSWDGGLTFPESAQTSAFGSPTGTWFKGSMAPTFTRGLPFNSVLGGLPNGFRATLQSVGGPITFGISLATFSP